MHAENCECEDCERELAEEMQRRDWEEEYEQEQADREAEIQALLD